MSENKLIHQGSLLALYREKVALRDGGHTYFDIIKHPGGAVIAAINEQQEICLLKQWRHAVQQHIWELPAGCLEVGEPPLETAKRELEEEAGVIAQQWLDLGTIYPSAGCSNEELHLFAAKEISAGVQKLDDAEQLEAHWLPLSKVKQMAISGEIVDAKTLAALYRLEAHFRL